jgi:F0F1-type ATP synthase delta subunit
MQEYLQALREAVGEERFLLAKGHFDLAVSLLRDKKIQELEHAPSPSKRRELLDSWFGNFIMDEVKNLIVVLGEKGELASFAKIRGEVKGEEEAVVTTPHPLSKELKEWFIGELTRVFPVATVHFRQDENIIGGVLLRVGDILVDHTLRSRIGI